MGSREGRGRPSRQRKLFKGKVYRLERTQVIARPLDEVFAFFADAANLEALTSPFLRFRFLTPLPFAMRVGVTIDYALSLYGVPTGWRSRITEWEPGVAFVDEQESGPYALWRHTHSFEARGDSTLVRDVVDYAEPFGPLGRLATSSSSSARSLASSISGARRARCHASRRGHQPGGRARKASLTA